MVRYEVVMYKVQDWILALVYSLPPVSYASGFLFSEYSLPEPYQKQVSFTSLSPYLHLANIKEKISEIRPNALGKT